MGSIVTVGQSIHVDNQAKGLILEKVNPGSSYQLAIPHKDEIYLCHSITSSPEKLIHSSKMNTAAPESGARVGQTSWEGRVVAMPPENPDISLRDPHIPYGSTTSSQVSSQGPLQQVALLKSEPKMSLSLVTRGNQSCHVYQSAMLPFTLETGLSPSSYNSPPQA